MATLYNCNPKNGALLQSSVARIDPLDGTPMVPRNATLVEPPNVQANEIAVWDGKSWSVDPDHRGTEYWLADGTHQTITEIGVVPPESALNAAPPPSLDELKETALSTMRGIALQVRHQIAASASPERALSWVLKAVYGAVWQVNEAAANPLLASLSTAAQAGFQLEADITGEDPVALRNRALEKAGLFFQANQLVEGMERLAEDRIPTATTIVELDTITTQLRTLETQSLGALAQFTS